jgi:O-antigen/teichoic acid export membrane protein
MAGTLKKRAFESGAWVMGGYMVSNFLRLGGNLILTRILVPEMFGIMAIITVLLAGVAMFSDIGIQQNIIRSDKTKDRQFLDTAWTIQVLRGFLIFSIMLIISISLYLLAQTDSLSANSVYAHPQLPIILAVMSLTVVISGFNSINLALLNRALNLKQITIMEFICQFLGLTTMVAFAFLYENIWGLVLGGFVSSFSKLYLSHSKKFGEKCRLHWNKEHAREIFHFGKWVFGASIFTFFAGRGDQLILGGLISAEQLGVYTIAFFLASAFRDVVKKVMSSVFFPVLSEVVRTRRKDLRSVYYRIRQKLDIAVMFSVGLLSSCGHVIIDVLYDDRYTDAGWMLEILALSSLFLGTTLAGPCLLALGNSKYIMIITAAMTVTLFTSVPLAFGFYGFEGAVVAIAMNALVEVPIVFYMMKQYNLLSLYGEFRMWPIFFATYALGHYFSGVLLQ